MKIILPEGCKNAVKGKVSMHWGNDVAAGRKLPTFSSLLAFDAAARHGTFSRAARELNVTQPAISRRIAELEADLGVVLFDRSSRPPRATNYGQRLFEVLRGGLSRLEEVVQEIRSAQTGDTVIIGANPGFASYWLLPRLSRLQQAFPNYNLRILTGDFSDDVVEVDLLIRFGTRPGTDKRQILGESVFAVCSPSYLGTRPKPYSLAELRQQRLLRLEDKRERWYSWKTWFEALGMPLKSMPRVVDFNDYALLVSAALAGEGVALCWEGLLNHFLDSGALVRVSKESVKSGRGYYVTIADLGNTRARRVADWLMKGGA